MGILSFLPEPAFNYISISLIPIGCSAIERQVELQDVDARFAQKAPLTPLSVLFNQFLNQRDIHPARPRHAVCLGFSRSRADVRIESAAGRGGHIRRNGAGVIRVLLAEVLNRSFHSVNKFLAGWPVI